MWRQSYDIIASLIFILVIACCILGLGWLGIWLSQNHPKLQFHYSLIYRHNKDFDLYGKKQVGRVVIDSRAILLINNSLLYVYASKLSAQFLFRVFVTPIILPVKQCITLLLTYYIYLYLDAHNLDRTAPYQWLVLFLLALWHPYRYKQIW